MTARTPALVSSMIEYFLTKMENAAPEGRSSEWATYITTEGPHGPVHWEDLTPFRFAARYIVLRDWVWSLAVDFCLEEVSDASGVKVWVQFIFEEDYARADEHLFYDSTFEFEVLDDWQRFVDTDLRLLEREVAEWATRVEIVYRDDDDQSDRSTERPSSEDEEA